MASTAEITNLSPDKVLSLLKKDCIFLVDVREPEEFARERIAGAFLYPLSSFDAHAIPEDDVHEVVFCCGSGKRSKDAALRWLAAGRPAISHLEGGIAAWKAANLPLKSPA